MILVIKELIRFYNVVPEDVFKKCRKPGVMRLSDYENFIRELVKTPMYFDDIEDTWKYWGEPDYLSQ